MKRHFLKFAIVTLLLSSLIYLSGVTAAADNIISSNVYINGISVGDMTTDDAMSALKKNLDPQNSNSYVLLKYGYELWRLDYKTLKISYNYQKGINDALLYSQNDSMKNSTTSSSVTAKASSALNTKSPRKDINMAFTYDKSALNNFFDMICKKIEVSPVDPKLSINGKKFKILSGKNGRMLDRDIAADAIVQNVALSIRKAIPLKLEVVKPKHDNTSLVNIKDKLGEYTTRFSSSDVDRVTNISIAAENLNGFILMPNDIISVNKTIGPRSEDTGFKNAHVIVNDELVDGIGGGICQVSTTLYNAVLLADLKIVERTHHSIPSTYVSLGRDATISGNYKDFKFQNNTNFPIYITSKVTKSHVTFTLYGKNEHPGRKVKIITRILSTIKPATKIVKDPTAPAGTIVKDKKAYSAYVVESSREVYEKGKLLYAEPLFTDKYPLINGLKIIGSKKN